MPAAPGEVAEDKQEKTEADAAFAWFGTALVVPQPAPALPRLPAANAIQLPDGQVPAGRAAPLPGTAPVTDPEPAPIMPEAPSQDAVAVELKALATPVVGVETKAPLSAGTAEAPAASERTAGPIRIELPPAQDTAPRTQPITLAAIQSRAESVQPLAAPLAAATIEAPVPRRPTAREATISALTTLTADAPRAHAVAATAEAQQPALDMRRHEWMNSMVERIEALRNSSGASGSRETSIRLSPDALGSVDISIRQEGDRVHVRFTAETPAARAALAEAQPRLAELAEARGLRLGQTSVDGGAAGQGQRQDTAPRPAFTSAPAGAPGGDPATDTDERIA